MSTMLSIISRARVAVAPRLVAAVQRSRPAVIAALRARPFSAAASTPDIDAEPINPEDYARQQQFDDADDDAEDAEEKPYFEEEIDPASAALRAQLLDAALKHVPELGWSHAALRAGAAQLGLSTAAVGVIPQGPAGLVEEVLDRAHKGMYEKVAAHPNFQQLSTSERLEFAVRARLEGIVPWLSQWPAALALVAQPSLAGRTMRRSAETIDDIWHVVGDNSSDVSWYSKRALLSSVYLSTELHLLTDRTVGQAATWAFLHRAMQNARRAAAVPAQAGSVANMAVNLAAAVWTRFVPTIRAAGMHGPPPHHPPPPPPPPHHEHPHPHPPHHPPPPPPHHPPHHHHEPHHPPPPPPPPQQQPQAGEQRNAF